MHRNRHRRHRLVARHEVSLVVQKDAHGYTYHGYPGDGARPAVGVSLSLSGVSRIHVRVCSRDLFYGRYRSFSLLDMKLVWWSRKMHMDTHTTDTGVMVLGLLSVCPSA